MQAFVENTFQSTIFPFILCILQLKIKFDTAIGCQERHRAQDLGFAVDVQIKSHLCCTCLLAVRVFISGEAL
jgi:hypothetical protein